MVYMEQLQQGIRFIFNWEKHSSSQFTGCNWQRLTHHKTSNVAAWFGWHSMPPPASNPDLWLFDLETGTQVASKVGNLPSKLGHARPLGSRIIRYVCDGRTARWTDNSNAYCPLILKQYSKIQPEVIPKLVATFRSPTASFIRLVVRLCFRDGGA